ncbi:hypothetical protein J6590_064339 [Homalodisca vitripennis]|nr:hypothetical protein J6590_064339 [Homalodisca vitripennis]
MCNVTQTVTGLYTNARPFTVVTRVVYNVVLWFHQHHYRASTEFDSVIPQAAEYCDGTYGTQYDKLSPEYCDGTSNA